MNEFDRAVVAAFDRMPLHWHDQWDAHVRDFIPLLERMAAWVQEYEAAGIDAAEGHANS